MVNARRKTFYYLLTKQALHWNFFGFFFGCNKFCRNLHRWWRLPVGCLFRTGLKENVYHLCICDKKWWIFSSRRRHVFPPPKWFPLSYSRVLCISVTRAQYNQREYIRRVLRFFFFFFFVLVGRYKCKIFTADPPYLARYRLFMVHVLKVYYNFQTRNCTMGRTATGKTTSEEEWLSRSYTKSRGETQNTPPFLH